ncbi:MAG: DUF4956 domain-containing protein [Pseudomonadales bacterium]|nr:DUF4956 domain-containing protein [Pseudomonadales bacterium]
MTNIDLITNVDFLFRFIACIFSLWILLHQIMNRFSPDKESIFGFFLFGCGVYLVTGLLHNVEMSMGFAFGLFAVFSMLRYRTESISIHNMTYLFLVIVTSLLSSVGPLTLLELIILNMFVCILVAVSEVVVQGRGVQVKDVTYDRIDLIKPENYQELLNDLCHRTGLNVVRADIENINFLRDTASLKIHFELQTKTRSVCEDKKMMADKANS